MPTKNFDEIWKDLRPVLERLLRQEAINHKEWHRLFSDVHNLCLWDEQMQNAKRLQEELQNDIKSYIYKSSEVCIFNLVFITQHLQIIFLIVYQRNYELMLLFVSLVITQIQQTS